MLYDVDVKDNTCYKRCSQFVCQAIAILTCHTVASASGAPHVTVCLWRRTVIEIYDNSRTLDLDSAIVDQNIPFVLRSNILFFGLKKRTSHRWSACGNGFRNFLVEYTNHFGASTLFNIPFLVFNSSHSCSGFISKLCLSKLIPLVAQQSRTPHIPLTLSSAPEGLTVYHYHA